MAFFSGVALVMMRHPIIGMLLELYGMVVLFGSYFPMLVSMLRQVGFAQKCDVQIPVVGPYVDKDSLLESVCLLPWQSSPLNIPMYNSKHVF